MNTQVLNDFKDNLAKRIKEEWKTRQDLIEQHDFDNECKILECNTNIKTLNDAFAKLESVITMVEDL